MRKLVNKKPNLWAIVINDDLTHRNLMSCLLEQDGWKVTAFEGAEAALSAQDFHSIPDLIVTEIHMPGIDGWRLCRMLRSPDYRPFNDIPVLAVSDTFSCEEASRITADLGAEPFLSAPFDGNGFMGKVRKIFENKDNKDRPRVLIVEAEKILGKVIKESFQNSGFIADLSSCRDKAEDLFKRMPYDIAVISHHLPDGAAERFLDGLKKDRPDCVFVVMTTDPDRNHALTWMKMGASAYIHKPFQPDRLVKLCINARREKSMIMVGDMLEKSTRRLIESEDRLRLAMQAARSGMWEWDLRSDETYWSDEIWELYGLDRNLCNASYDSWIGSVSSQDRPVLEDRIRDATINGLDLKVEWRVNHNEGQERWLLLRGQPIPISEGRPDSYRGIVLDITENKKRELDLLEQGKYLQAVLHTTAEGFLMINAEGRIYDANAAYCRMTGFSLADLQEMYISDIDCLESPSEMRGHMKRIMEEGAEIFETRHRCKDGGVLDMEVSTSYLDAYGGKFINFCRDITERKEIESEHNIVMTLLSIMNNANNMNDLLKTILILMKKWSGCEAVGIRLKDGMDFPYFQTMGFPPEFVKMESRLCAKGPDGERVINGEGNYELECMCGNIIMGHYDPDLPFFTERGSFWTNSTTDLIASSDEKDLPEKLRNRCNSMGYESMALIPLRYGEKPLGLLQFNDSRRGMFDRKKISLLERLASNLEVLDIIGRKRSADERSVLESQFRQTQKMESVGRLAAGVAHDYNNMLSVIIGNAELALDMLDQNQPIFDKLVEIRQAAKRSADLTLQLLTFARKATITPRIINLRETIDGMLKMLRRLIGEDIALDFIAYEGLWPVKMDPSQIEQILSNLCLNARDAIEGVGNIRIETKNVSTDEISCVGNMGIDPGDYVLLSVIDDGKGIEKFIIDKVFEPFFTTKDLGKVTGLGLATVYGIVKQNNGAIEIESEPGQGATIMIYLPRHMGKSEKETKPHGTEMARGRETILIVEDDPSILSIISKILKKEGYSVLAASRPGEAISLAESHPGELNLIISDVIMPEMNGSDLVKKILSFCPNAKRLFMSGHTADVIVHYGVLEEGIHFIQKPFLINDMVAKVREVLDSE